MVVQLTSNNSQQNTETNLEESAQFESANKKGVFTKIPPQTTAGDGLKYY